MNVNRTTTAPTTECYCKALILKLPTYFSPQWVAYLSNIFDIGSAHIQSDDCCLKGYFKKTWAELFKAEFNKITQG